MKNKDKDKKTRMLLIDDDPEDRLLMEESLLKMNGGGQAFQLETARNLQEALLRLAKGGIDVILLDLMLPDSHGMETFTKISRAVPAIPVIILSVLYDDGLAIEAVRKGAQDYIFKREAHHDVLARTIKFSIERNSLRQELARAYTRLEKLALIDPVTELFNRRGLQEILSHEIQRAQKKHSNLLVILVDLDDFKKINNALGHNTGDVVLKEVAVKLKASLRPTDYVGRVGGDEFMVFLPETSFAEGMRLAEKIRLAIASTVVSMSITDDVKVTASLGLINLGMVNLSESELSINDMISRIHILLHKNKQSGKNRISFDEGEVYYDSLSEIPEMLGDDRKYHALVQPIFRLSDKTEAGYEFLSRSSIKGFEMPDDFFRAALEANMLVKVDYQCLKNCVQAAALLPPGCFCNMNLYPSTIINLPIDTLLNLLVPLKSKINVCVEISEQQILGDPSYLLEAVSALRKAGIHIAIDDLGFGRSCLESLILLEPDIVKIDKKCVTGVSEEETPLRSLKRLLKMAKSLGAEVVAEGVETQKDLDLLVDLGVKYGQGYFLGRPRPLKSEVTSRKSSTTAPVKRAKK
jgi:diguanylate cyclase (GGDEF)-like protein